VEHSDSTLKETIMSNMYELARQLQAPGVQTVATFNPTRLTKTLRNLARKSIASGKHNGGWSSQTKSVRDLVIGIAGEKPIVYAAPAHSGYIAFHSPRPVLPNIRAEIEGLLEADCSLSKMSFVEDKKGYYRPTTAEFNTSMDDRLKTNIKRLDEVSNKSYSLIIKNKTIRDQIVTAFLKERTVEEIAIAERIARLLDKDEEFPIPTTHNF
jgi:hypothetical protein